MNTPMEANRMPFTREVDHVFDWPAYLTRGEETKFLSLCKTGVWHFARVLASLISVPRFLQIHQHQSLLLDVLVFWKHWHQTGCFECTNDFRPEKKTKKETCLWPKFWKKRQCCVTVWNTLTLRKKPTLFCGLILLCSALCKSRVNAAESCFQCGGW